MQKLKSGTQILRLALATYAGVISLVPLPGYSGAVTPTPPPGPTPPCGFVGRHFDPIPPQQYPLGDSLESGGGLWFHGVPNPSGQGRVEVRNLLDDSEVRILYPFGVGTNGKFGASLDYDNGRLLVGSSDMNHNTARRADIIDPITGAHIREFIDHQGGNDNWYARVVALEGDRVYITAPFGADPNGHKSGVVHEYDAVSGVLVRSFSNPPGIPNLNPHFGWSLDADPTHVLIGEVANFENHVVAGKAHLFDASTGAPLFTLDSPFPSFHGRFGHQVLLRGGLAMVSEPGYDSQGALHFFDVETGLLQRTIVNPIPHEFGFGEIIKEAGGRIAARTSVSAFLEPVHLISTDTGDRLGRFDHLSLPGQVFEYGDAVAFDGTWLFAYGYSPTSRGIIDRFHVPDGCVTPPVLPTPTSTPTPGPMATPIPSSDCRSVRSLGLDFPRSHDRFGYAVDYEENLALIGSWSHDTDFENDGAAWLYDIVTGELLHTFRSPFAGAEQWFGFSVALHGNHALIGAPWDDRHSPTSGRAFLFDVDTGALIRTFRPDIDVPQNRFGSGVELTDQYAIIACRHGAARPYGPGPEYGSLHVFELSTGTRLHILEPEGWWSYGYRFGYAFAADGSTLVVGMRGEEDPIVFDLGTGAELFSLPRPNLGLPWESEGLYGASVAISGGRIIVGAPRPTASGPNPGGRAHVFDATTGAHLTVILNPDQAARDFFGWSVALAGDRAIVGTYGPVEGGAGSTVGGIVRVFDAATGVFLESISNPVPAAGDGFGFSLAADGNGLLVGAYRNNYGVPNSGSAFVFNLGPCVSPTPFPTSSPTPAPTATASPAPCCPGDADKSGGNVNANDFLAVQGAFGADNGPGGTGDADCSGGAVNANDFLAVQGAFGSNCD